MTDASRLAPGWPGIPPRWTSSAKSGIGTALRASRRVWFVSEEKRDAASHLEWLAPGVPGAVLASLSIPWGDTKGDNDLGGYHLVWPRDLVEAAGGLLARVRCVRAAARHPS